MDQRERQREKRIAVCVSVVVSAKRQTDRHINKEVRRTERHRGQTDRETQRSDDSLFTAQWQIVSVSACRPRVIPSDHGSDRGMRCSRSDRISKLTG